MAGIWIATLITSLLSMGLIGFLIAKISPADDRRFLVLVAVLNLPMWFAAFYLVRLPMDSALRAMLGAGATTTAFLFVTTILYAPVTEESAKLTLMLFPWFRRMPRMWNDLSAPLAGRESGSVSPLRAMSRL